MGTLLLTDDHKQKLMAAAISFLEGYDVSGEGMLDSIVPGDETWISHLSP